MPEEIIYTSPAIFTGTEWLTAHAIVCEEGRIKQVLPYDAVADRPNLIQYDEAVIAPAFIDLQIYGAAGRLFAVYPEPDSLSKLADYCRSGGAAFCLTTLATNELPVFKKGIDAVREYWQQGGTGVYGLHLEGPWINPVKRGAHVEALIHSPQPGEVKELLEYGKDVIKMITLAPEVCSREVTDLILSYGIIISAGHSNATYEEAKKGFDAGINAVTHLFNAMSPLQHRNPGLAGAAMDDERIMASIIPDGHHVDYAAVRIAKKVMKERLFAITDAVTTTGEGYYKHQPAGDKYEADGILSGSSLTMNKALQNLVHHAGIETAEALRMCSLYPARLIGANDMGKIEPGANASLVVLNNKLDVIETIM
ncbi:MAG: N-acetylglucosamine-6-phosphate deacetylase [Chitinophagaceae bacterium]|nr:N-acetylglucosamine-6-phosphate deacetylase [Chitinophagaceae bacterium]